MPTGVFHAPIHPRRLFRGSVQLCGYSRDEVRDIRRKAARECRNELDAKTMTGPDRRRAMRACVAEKLPSDVKQRAGGMRETRQVCRDEVRAKGLRGPERRDAIDACLRQKRPDLAKRLDCQKEARTKGLSGTKRRDFMRGCAA
jgi:psiF repeat